MIPERIIRDATANTVDWAVEENTGSGLLTQDVDIYLRKLSSFQSTAQVIRVLSECSNITGGYVKMLPAFHYVPVLLGADGNAVPLYEFVEVLDDAIDYDSIIEELPSLTYPQISGAIAFLRKMAQTNPENIDIDRIEDEQLSQDPEFIEELRRALADKETSRVLSQD